MNVVMEAFPPEEHFTSDSDELSDEQIEQLLKQAETRLREQQAVSLASGRYTPAVPAAGKLDISNLPKPYVQKNGDIAHADKRRLLDEKNRKLAEGGIRKVEDPVLVKKRELEIKKATAGSDWFNLPATNLTPELKRDLQLLKMRGVLDPHRHYKKDSNKSKAPAFSQVGTLIEGPTEFFSGRLTNKERKRTLVEEIMDNEKDSGRLKRKYGEIQAVKTSGKKGDYKKAMAKKYGSKVHKR